MRAEIQSVAWMTPAEVRRELTRTSLTVCRETRSFRQLHRALLPRSKEETLLAALLPRAARWGQACRRVTEGRRNRSSAAFRSGGTESSNPASSSRESRKLATASAHSNANGTVCALRAPYRRAALKFSACMAARKAIRNPKTQQEKISTIASVGPKHPSPKRPRPSATCARITHSSI